MNQGWVIGRNRLLAGLPAADRARIEPDLEPVAMRAGEVLREDDVAARHAYFPTSGIVSVGFVTRDGSSSSLAMIGNEGLVNVPLLLGGQSAPSHSHVLVSGQALRVRGDLLL